MTTATRCILPEEEGSLGEAARSTFPTPKVGEARARAQLVPATGRSGAASTRGGRGKGGWEKRTPLLRRLLPLLLPLLLRLLLAEWPETEGSTTTSLETRSRPPRRLRASSSCNRGKEVQGEAASLASPLSREKEARAKSFWAPPGVLYLVGP